MRKKVRCVICNKDLGGRQLRYCSPECATEARKLKKPYKFMCQCGCGKIGYSSSRKQKFLNRSHAARYQMKNRNQWGENNPNWKGGITKHSKGYKYKLNPSHPRATKTGYVLEHILVAEKEEGRSLREQEVIHHINGIKDDNRPENLIILPKKEHDELHREGYLLIIDTCSRPEEPREPNFAKE